MLVPKDVSKDFDLSLNFFWVGYFFLGGIFRGGEFSWGGIFRGGDLTWGEFSEGEFPGGDFSCNHYFYHIGMENINFVLNATGKHLQARVYFPERKILTKFHVYFKLLIAIPIK